MWQALRCHISIFIWHIWNWSMDRSFFFFWKFGIQINWLGAKCCDFESNIMDIIHNEHTVRLSELRNYGCFNGSFYLLFPFISALNNRQCDLNCIIWKIDNINEWVSSEYYMYISHRQFFPIEKKIRVHLVFERLIQMECFDVYYWGIIQRLRIGKKLRLNFSLWIKLKL